MARIAKPVSFARAIADKRAALADRRKDLADMQSQAKSFEPAYAIANAIIDNAKAIGFSKHYSARPETTIYSWGEVSNHLVVSIEDTVTSLREGVVPAILEAVESYGLEAVGTHDYALEYCASRVFRFEKKIGNVSLTVRIEANIADGSEQCRKVQTGVKLEEVPTYEIQCS